MKISPSTQLKPPDLSITLFEDEVKLGKNKCALSYLLFIGTRLNFFPFQWDHNEHRLALNDFSGRASFFTNLIIIFGYASLKFYLSLRKEFLEGPNKMHSVIECLFFVLFALAILLSFNNVYHAEDIVAFMNTYLWRVRVEIGKQVLLHLNFHFNTAANVASLKVGLNFFLTAHEFDTEDTIDLLEIFWKGYLRTLHLIVLGTIPLFLKSKFTTYLSLEGANTYLYVFFLVMDLYALYTFLMIMGFYTYFIVDCTIVVEKLSQSMR